MTEKIFIIQPILPGYEGALHAEAVALIESAGAIYIGSSYQTIKEINAATFVGSGKLAEISATLEGLEDVTVLFNGSLSPSQTLNISSALGGRKVIDRTTLILDIFARNAVTGEGKYQVEIAQLKYIYPRLKGKGAALSRLGGGIGSRGPGETQLETDRRHIAYRIKFLESKLAEARNRRKLQTARRQKENIRTVALVGYTNTGKSTLLNLLTGSDVLSQDALFVTLDPTARKCLIDGEEYLIVDTVGFIRELPHNIVEAFKSTLEVAVNCDLALFVADASQDYEKQLEVTENTLSELGFDNDFIKVLNKYDKAEGSFPKDCLLVSAKTGYGIEQLKNAIKKKFADRVIEVRLSVPYGKIEQYKKLKALIVEKEIKYTENGMEITALVDARYSEKFKDYIS